MIAVFKRPTGFGNRGAEGMATGAGFNAEFMSKCEGISQQIAKLIKQRVSIECRERPGCSIFHIVSAKIVTLKQQGCAKMIVTRIHAAISPCVCVGGKMPCLRAVFDRTIRVNIVFQSDPHDRLRSFFLSIDRLLVRVGMQGEKIHSHFG